MKIRQKIKRKIVEAKLFIMLILASICMLKKWGNMGYIFAMKGDSLLQERNGVEFQR